MIIIPFSVGSAAAAVRRGSVRLGSLGSSSSKPIIIIGIFANRVKLSRARDAIFAKCTKNEEEDFIFENIR